MTRSASPTDIALFGPRFSASTLRAASVGPSVTALTRCRRALVEVAIRG